MKFNNQFKAWLLPVLAAALLGNLTDAATLTVTNLADSGPGTLRNQIAAAASGDSIEIEVPGTIVLNSQLTISTNLTIYGYNGSPPTEVSGNNSHRVFNITGGTSIFNNFGIINGRVVGTNGASGFNGQNIYGGGILVASGAGVALEECLVSNNVVVGGQPGAGAFGGNGYGGGIANLGLGFVEIQESLVISNASTGGSGGASNGGGQAWGGAIYTEGSTYIYNVTIDMNVATGGPGGGGLGTGAGGAIYNVGGMNIHESTIVSNAAAGPGANYGGAIQDFGTTTINDSTIFGNQATYGGGITGGTIYNTILAGNSASSSGPDGYGTIGSGDYNLIQNTSGITFSGTTTHNLTGKNPLLGPLQYNGGLQEPLFEVLTLAPLPGSPVIDQGTSVFDYDQRGFPRPYDTAIPNAAGGNGADIGAIEINPTTVTVLNTNDSGSGSLRQAILDNNGLGGGNTVTFSNAVTGSITLTSGELAVSAPVTVLGPGASLLALSANHNGRVFDILAGPASISGLTLRDGLVAGTPGASGQIGSNGRGGGIYNQDTLSLSNCLVLSNSVVGGLGGSATTGTAGNGGMGLGGGIYNAAGNLIINQCSFVGNSSLGGTGGNATSGYAGYAGNGLGGAICTISGTNTLSACTLMNGSATGGQGGVATSGGSPGIGGQGYGGGLYSESTVNILNSTIGENNATAGTGGGGPGNGIGGGIYNVDDMNLTNCTIANNNASGSSYDSGGGFYNEGALQVISCTIAGNQADYGGGVDGNMTAGNTILAGNAATTAGPDGSGTINSDDYNLIQTLSGLSIVGITTHVIVGQNPLLEPLANNGGQTFTMALSSGSPAIDQGKNFGIATDQRGVVRPYDLPSIANAGGGDGSDIGAFEFLPTPKLNIQAVIGNNIVLYWTSDAASYRLESATALSPAISWSNVTSTRVTIGNQVYTTNSMAGASQFYQLIYP